jgi:hypothetical protein
MEPIHECFNTETNGPSKRTIANLFPWNNNIYVMGGFGHTNVSGDEMDPFNPRQLVVKYIPLDHLWEYNIQNQRWKLIKTISSQFPQYRSSPFVTQVYKDNLHVLGVRRQSRPGESSSDVLEFWRLNMIKLTWSTLPIDSYLDLMKKKGGSHNSVHYPNFWTMSSCRIGNTWIFVVNSSEIQLVLYNFDTMTWNLIDTTQDITGKLWDDLNLFAYRDEIYLFNSIHMKFLCYNELTAKFEDFELNNAITERDVFFIKAHDEFVIVTDAKDPLDSIGRGRSYSLLISMVNLRNRRVFEYNSFTFHPRFGMTSTVLGGTTFCFGGRSVDGTGDRVAILDVWRIYRNHDMFSTQLQRCGNLTDVYFAFS